MLDQEQLRRRMIAARNLAGFKQTDLDQRFQADKLSMITGKLERGESEIGDSYIRSMVKHLKVPMDWFAVDDLERWMARASGLNAGADDQEAQVHFERAEALAEMFEAQVLLDRAQARLKHSDLPPGEIGNG